MSFLSFLFQKSKVSDFGRRQCFEKSPKMSPPGLHQNQAPHLHFALFKRQENDQNLAPKQILK